MKCCENCYYRELFYESIYLICLLCDDLTSPSHYCDFWKERSCSL